MTMNANSPPAKSDQRSKEPALSDEEFERLCREERERLNELLKSMSWDARAVMRATLGWEAVTSDDHWRHLSKKARRDYRKGSFLIDRLGANRLLDPKLMATLWDLRQSMIDEFHATSTAQLMLIDQAVLAYYHALRLNGWIGDFALHIEHEFFGTQGPSLNLEGRYGSSVRSFKAEDHIARIAEELLPIIDRFNRIVRDNINAVKAIGSGPNLDIERLPRVQVDLG